MPAQSPNTPTYMQTSRCYPIARACLVDDGVGGSGGHSAVVVPAGHQDVALVAPVGGPRVLHQPIVFTVERPVPHGKNSMVQALRAILTVVVIVHPVGIETKRLEAGINSDRDGAHVGNGVNQCCLVSRWEEGEVGDGDTTARLVSMAHAVLRQGKHINVRTYKFRD